MKRAKIGTASRKNKRLSGGCTKFSNLNAKSVVTSLICGYLCGILIVFAWHVNTSDGVGPNNLRDLSIKWCWLSLAFFIILLLAYSRSVRCIIALCIPILFSTKGRSFLLSCAYILAATGPIANILRNVDVIMNSISCGETRLKVALEEMIEVIKQPLVAIRNTIKTVMDNVRGVLRKVELFLFRIKELVLVILAGIKNAFDWLANIVKFCNREMGTPFERCMNTAEKAMADCREKLGAFKGLCYATHMFSSLCYTVKVVDAICIMIVFLDDTIFQTIMENLNIFTEEVKNIFDVSVTFDHDFSFRTVASQNLTDVATSIKDEIHARFYEFFILLGWLDIVSGVLCFLVIAKAIYFKVNYLSSLSYHNSFITKEFLELDEKLQRKNLPRALPLKKGEKNRYAWLMSWRLTPKEILKMLRSAMFMTISCAQLFCICFADYSLYWILAMINYYGSKVNNVEVPQFIKVDVEGGGLIGDIFRGIVEAFQPINQKYNIDATPCLPAPKAPNFTRYYEIAMICLAAWIFIICQAHALRLRHIVMNFFYPEDAAKRAAWLHNDILKRRETLLKKLRRIARSKFRNSVHGNPYKFCDWLRKKMCNCFLCFFLIGRKTETCVLCGFAVDDDKVVCENPNCAAIYCHDCYEDSSKLCCICKSPLDYGDNSDISEVQDSSEEELRKAEPSNEKTVRESDNYYIWVP